MDRQTRWNRVEGSRLALFRGTAFLVAGQTHFRHVASSASGKNANRGLLNSSTLSQTFAFSSSTYFFPPVSRIGKLDPIRSAYYNMQTVSKSRIVVTQLLILKEKYHFVEILFNVKRINQNFLIYCMLVYTLIKNCSMYSRVTIHTVVFFSNSLCIELIDFPFVSRNGRNFRCN